MLHQPLQRAARVKYVRLTRSAAPSSDAAGALEMAGACLADMTVRLAMSVVPLVVSVCGEVCVCYFPHDHGYVPARGLCVCSMPSNPRAPPFSHLGMWYTAGIQQQPSISTVGSSN